MNSISGRVKWLMEWDETQDPIDFLIQSLRNSENYDEGVKQEIKKVVFSRHPAEQDYIERVIFDTQTPKEIFLSAMGVLDMLNCPVFAGLKVLPTYCFGQIVSHPDRSLLEDVLISLIKMTKKDIEPVSELFSLLQERKPRLPNELIKQAIVHHATSAEEALQLLSALPVKKISSVVFDPFFEGPLKIRDDTDLKAVHSDLKEKLHIQKIKRQRQSLQKLKNRPHRSSFPSKM